MALSPFKQAFADARKAGKSVFTFNGKKYTTELAKPKAKAKDMTGFRKDVPKPDVGKAISKAVKSSADKPKAAAPKKPSMMANTGGKKVYSGGSTKMLGPKQGLAPKGLPVGKKAEPKPKSNKQAATPRTRVASKPVKEAAKKKVDRRGRPV